LPAATSRPEARDRLGIRIASTARVMAEPLTRATTGWKRCSWRPRPPSAIESPRASSRLAITVPVMLALTMSTRPARSATRAMISSVALPNRALSRAPIEGPRARDSSSVAVLSQIARGRIARAELKNTGRSPQCHQAAAQERGSAASRPVAASWRSEGVRCGWSRVDTMGIAIARPGSGILLGLANGAQPRGG